MEVFKNSPSLTALYIHTGLSVSAPLFVCSVVHSVVRAGQGQSSTLTQQVSGTNCCRSLVKCSPCFLLMPSRDIIVMRMKDGKREGRRGGLMALGKKRRRRKEEVKVEGEARKEGNGRNKRFEDEASERKQW